MIPTMIKGWQLAHKAHPNTSNKYVFKQKLKILLLVLIYPKFAKQWFKKIKTTELKKIYLYRPGLYVKPLRVYMSTQWGVYQRSKVILDTYTLLTNHPNNKFKRILTTNDKLLLATFTLKNGSHATAYAGYDIRFRKEGEVVIFLESEELGLIASIAFSFEEIQNESFVCRIGCFQGNRVEHKNIFKEMQKLLHGQRPSSLMLFLVQEFIKYLPVSKLYGVSNSIQANLQKHAIHIHKLHKITFNYDTLWNDAQGQLKKDGWFELPLISRKKPIEELKSKKRLMYKKRYKLQDDISREFNNNIG